MVSFITYSYTDAYSCSNSAQVTINVNALPSVDAIIRLFSWLKIVRINKQELRVIAIPIAEEVDAAVPAEIL